MPIYEFQCEVCKHIFEEIRKLDDGINIHSFCPKCKENGKDAIALKIISKSSYRMKGFSASNGYSKQS